MWPSWRSVAIQSWGRLASWVPGPWLCICACSCRHPLGVGLGVCLVAVVEVCGQPGCPRICSSTLDTPLLQHMRQILMLTRRNIDGGATLMRFIRRSGVPRVPYHGASPPKLATTSGPPASSGQTWTTASSGQIWTKGSVAASEQRCSRVSASHGQPGAAQDEAPAEDRRREVSSFTVRGLEVID